MKHNMTTANTIDSDTDILNLISISRTREKGYRLLMSLYQERLYWHIRRMTHIHEDADDVLQNTFIKVFKNIDKFNEKSKLYTWLYRIATNESITFINKKKRITSESIDDIDSSIKDALQSDPYWDGDRVQLVLQLAMNTLPEKQKAVFCLRYYDEMPYRDISSVLKTSEGALKANYHHAVKKIEAFIENNTDEY